MDSMNTQLVVMWALTIVFGAVSNLSNFISEDEAVKTFFAALFFLFLLLSLLWTAKAAMKGG
jgi:hypothetical protein